MPSDSIGLAPLQQWMQQVVTHPGDVHEALRTSGAASLVAPADLGSVILASKTLKPIERVGIYHSMYMMRMVDALTSDYPGLVSYLGEHDFSHVAEEYVQRYPSRSYTLNRLGDHLPEFLKETTLPKRTFLCDLARLELAMTQVFDETEREPMTREEFGVTPQTIERARFIPIPALRLLEFTYDANAAFQNFRDEEQIRPVRQKSWLSIHRRDYSVYRTSLAKPAYILLHALVNGRTLGEAMASFKRRLHRFPETDELFAWFRDWNAAGLFAGVALPPL